MQVWSLLLTELSASAWQARPLPYPESYIGTVKLGALLLLVGQLC